MHCDYTLTLCMYFTGVFGVLVGMKDKIKIQIERG